VDGKNGDKPVVQGAKCSRGINYAIEELANPVRTLTSTVRVKGGLVGIVPVRTAKPVPKSKIRRCMDAINALEARAPVYAGDVLTHDIEGTGIAVVATWNVPRIGDSRH